MGYLETALIAITIVMLAVGLLYGFMRGAARSVLRAVIVAAAVVVALCLREKVATSVLSWNVGGVTVQDRIVSAIPENYASFVSVVLPVVQIVAAIVCFVVSLALLQWASMIVFAILKIVVRPRIFGHRFRLIGAIVGLAQGAALAFFFCVPIVGVLTDVNALTKAEYEGKTIVPVSEQYDFDKLESSDIYKIYRGIGGDFYAFVSKGKDGDGEERSLSSQVNGVVSAVRIADIVSKMRGGLSDGFDATSAEAIRGYLADLGSLKNDLQEKDPAALDVLDEVIVAATKSLGLPVDMSEFSLKEIDFDKEGAFLGDLVAYEEKGEMPEIGELVGKLAESTVVLPVLNGAEVKIPLSDGEKAEAEQALATLEDKEQAQKIRELFGLAAS